MAQALAIADDLTGALEVGAILAGLGVPALVTLDVDHAPVEGVLVIDSETRHVAPDVARVLHRRLAARWHGPIFKKTDSTLRGNIGAEFTGLIEATGRRLVYIPAYPKAGRTVRDSVLYVDGVPITETVFARDPRNPVRESSVAALMARDCAFPVEVRDASTDDELAAIAGTLDAGALVASPAGFTSHWAARLPRRGPARLPAVGSFRILCGSLHPRSREQAAEAARLGWEVLSTGEFRAGEQARAASELAEAALALPPVDALVIFGGDTTHAVLSRLGLRDLEPLGEVEPGVPVSRGGGLILITKAGGFGPPDLAARIRAKLEKAS